MLGLRHLPPPHHTPTPLLACCWALLQPLLPWPPSPSPRQTWWRWVCARREGDRDSQHMHGVMRDSCCGQLQAAPVEGWDVDR